MKEYPKHYDPKATEEKWSTFWEENNLFQPKKKDLPPFSIVIPPPNVTGVLHMGHALVNTIQDILIRFKRMQGYETLWIPGTDHAGIATQAVVERHLLQTTGKRRADIPKETFLKEVWKWKETSEKTILGQIRKLGASCDWSKLCFTMDEDRSKATRTAFKQFFDEGLIYQGDYLVNWDPVLQTALSDDEVEHVEESSFLWYIRYPLSDKSGSILIATTRPETLLGDTAVAVHPKDPRYQALIGKTIDLPLTNRTIPIVADPFVEPEFGTGAVKITPAHDWNDFEMGQRHNLERINILTPDAKINDQGGVFKGLDVLEARKALIQELEKQGLLEKTEPYTLRLGLSYRSKAIIQPYLSKQWFFKMSAFKKELLKTIQSGEIEIVPPHFIQTYTHWIENLRDWCISRQIIWGHPIPIWYHTSGTILCSDEPLPKEVEKSPDEWQQDTDVLDTWFSSALWPFSTLGWPESTSDLATFYPTSVLVTGHDILFFWVARMILMGKKLTGEKPFNRVFLHGLIYGKSYWRVDPSGHLAYVSKEEKRTFDLGEPLPKDVKSKWEKMSKSKGNVLDPLEVIEEYGTDALRIALTSSVTHARQIDLDLRRFEEFKNFANKVWNGARFVLTHLHDLSEKTLLEEIDFQALRLEDHWILERMQSTTQELLTSFENYTFDRAAKCAYEFFWNDFCSLYVEISKPILFGKQGSPKERTLKQKLLLTLLLSSIRLLHPMTPFITEELFSLIREPFKTLKTLSSTDPLTEETLQALKASACIIAPYPKVLNLPLKNTQAMEDLFEIVRLCRNIRMQMQIPPSEKIDLYLIAKSKTPLIHLIEEHLPLIQALTPIARLEIQQEEPEGLGAKEVFKQTLLFVPIPKALQEKEQKRLKKEQEKLQSLSEKTRRQLNNPAFVSKAPPHIVENLQKTLEETLQKLQEIEKELERFSP